MGSYSLSCSAGPRADIPCSLWSAHTRAEEKGEREGKETPLQLVFYVALLMGLTVTCSDNLEEEEKNLE